MKSNRKAMEGRSSGPCSPPSYTPETDAVVALLRQNTSPVEIPVLIGHAMRMEAERDELKDMIADKSRLDWLLTNHVANFECVENIAGNLERYHIPATREAIDAEILRENARAMPPVTESDHGK